MAIRYVDLVSGNDSNAGTVKGSPKRTINSAIAAASTGDTIKVAGTGAHTTLSSGGAGTATFTDNSNIVTMSSWDLTGTITAAAITAGFYIGKTTAAGNGAIESFYRVTACSATQITLEARYYGTTATSSSMYQLKYVTTGAAGVSAVTVNKALTISGGWDLSATPETQTLETWFKSNNARTSSAALPIYATAGGSTWDRLNVAEGYYNHTPNALATTITNCTSTGGYVVAINCSGAAMTLSNIMAIGGSTGAITNAAAASTFSGVKAISSTAGSAYASFPVSDGQNQCTAYNSYIGVSSTASPSVITRFSFIGCTESIRTAATSAVITANTIAAGSPIVGSPDTFGVNVTTAGYDALIANNTFTGIKYAINYTGVTYLRIGCWRIQSNTFTSCTYDIYGAAATSVPCNVHAIANTHNSVGTQVYGRGDGAGQPWILQNETIDVASQSKVFSQVTSSGRFLAPQFICQKVDGIQDGIYYANSSVTKDPTVTSPAGYSTIRVANQASVTTAYVPYKLFSSFVRSGVAKTVTVKYRAVPGTAFSGTITPQIYLDGALIVTGTNITSIPTDGSWTTLTISVSAGLITRDGELSFELLHAGNTVAVAWGDFTCA